MTHHAFKAAGHNATRERVLGNIAATMTAAENLRVQDRMLVRLRVGADTQEEPSRCMNLLGLAYAVTSMHVRDGKYSAMQRKAMTL